MRKTPTSVTVLSILGLLFGALGLCGLGSSALVFTDINVGPNPVLDAMRKDKIILAVTGVQVAVGALSILLLLASSVGSLQLAPWARMGMIIYALIAIVVGILGMVFNLVYIVPLTLSNTAPNNPAATGGAIGGAIGGVFGGVIGMIYPVCILYFYTRPHVIDAFQGIFPDTARFGDDYDDREDYDDRTQRRSEDIREDRGRRRDPEDDRFTDRG